jgi:hypothetical protein
MCRMVSAQLEPSPEVADPILRDLSERVLRHLPALTESVTDKIFAQMAVYGSETVVTREELTDSVSANLKTMIDGLCAPDAVDLDRARATGTRRARQGVPLPEVLRAFRIGFSALWDLMLDLAALSGEIELRTMIAATSRFWYLIDQYLEAVTCAYRDSTAELTRAQRQRRGALLEALLTGRVMTESGMWDVNRLLGLPRDGTFVVVAAEAGELASATLTGVERALSERRMSSAWRLTPSHELGIVSLGSASRLPELTALLNERATVRIGISPTYTGLENTPRALHMAHVARTSIPVGEAHAACFDDSPLSVLVAAAPDESVAIARRILGPILNMPTAERDVLIETVDAWIATGSAKLTAQQLFCHPNTVRYRLQRVQIELHLSLTDPVQLAQLVVALRAWRLFDAVGPS